MQYFKFIGCILLIAVAACAPKVGQETTGKIDQKEDFRAMAPKAGPARTISIGESHNFKLANGLTVIVVENHKLPQISYQLTIDRDPNLEKEKAGLANITGSLISTGTKKRTKSEIDEAVDYIGANLSTNANGGFASSLTKHTDKILEIFSDVMLHPSFPEAEFEKIKTQTLSGLQANKEDPNAISQNVSQALIYGLDHPYGEITNEITVANINLEDCKQYYATNFQPGSAYLVIVGDIKPEVAKAQAEKYFGSWSAGTAPRYTYSAPKPVDNTSVAFVNRDGAVQSVINVTYAIDLKPNSPDVIACRVMNMILGGSFAGRLDQNLREDKAYTYGANSHLETDKLVGSFYAFSSVRNEVTDSAVGQFMYELNRMNNEPVSQKELDLAKNYIAGSFARSLESPQTVANFALNKMRYNLPENYYDTYLQKLAAITIADVSRVAKKYILPGKARIVVVGNKDEVMEKLVPYDKEDGKIQLYDVYANPKKDEAATGDVDPMKLIDAYLAAIGGKTKLETVKGMEQVYSLDLMGMSMTMKVVQEQGKYFMSMTAPGMNLMKQAFDGESAVAEQMGQRVPIEGEDLETMREQSLLFPERFYVTDGYEMEVKGTEDVGGKSCYKLVVNKPSGVKSTEYYDKESYFKLKEVQTGTTQGQVMTTTFEFNDYKSVDGVQVPHTVTISGGGTPAPMVMKASSIKINPTVDPSIFKL